MRALGSLILTFALLAGCSSEEDPFAIRLLKIPEGESAFAGCPDFSAASLREQLKTGQYNVRYTFMQRPASAGPRDLRRFDLTCYRVVAKGESSEFLVPTDVPRLSLMVEAFDTLNGDRLAFVGLAHDIDLAAKDVEVILHPTRRLSCGYGERERRAFHSATLLPNGQVLTLGGIVSSSGVELPEEMNASNRATVFDPRTLAWRVLTPTQPLLARAFHQAVLLPSPAEGPYEVLLVGGMLATEGGPVARRRASDIRPTDNPEFFPCSGAPGELCSYHFSYLPHEASTAAGAAIVTYDPGAGSIEVASIDGLMPSFFPQLSLDASGSHAMVVSGANRYTAETAATQGFSATSRVAEWVTLQGRGQRGASLEVQQLGTGALRAGHAVAALGTGYLILGGNMEGAASTLVTQQAEWGATSGFSQAVASALVPTAFHTLTPLGVSDLDLAGGINPGELVFAGGIPLGAEDTRGYSSAIPTENPVRTSAIARLRLQNNTLSELPSSVVTGFEHAGYHAALRLHDGGVLLSGGNFKTLCPRADGENTLLTTYCPSDALVVLDPDSSDLTARELPTVLNARRYGHRATRLLDNTVLFSGGISIDTSGTPSLVEKSELLSPLDHTIESPPLWVERDGQPMAPNTMSQNSTANGACALRSGTDQESSAMKTLTVPLPLDKMRRRMRSVRVFLPSAAE